MANGNGRSDAPDERDELPPGLSAWFAIEECVGETLDALRALGEDADQAHAFVSGIHRAVKVWLSWELWAALLDPGHYTPGQPAGVASGRERRRAAAPAGGPSTPPVWGRAAEWRAFTDGSDDV